MHEFFEFDDGVTRTESIKTLMQTAFDFDNNYIFAPYFPYPEQSSHSIKKFKTKKKVNWKNGL